MNYFNSNALVSILYHKLPLNATKFLFCCVRSFRALALAMLVLLVICSTSLIALAADSNNNEFVDFNEYAEYEFSDDNSSVTIDVSFPAEWNISYIEFGETGRWYTGNEFYVEAVSEPWYKINMHSMGGKMTWVTNVGSQITNAHFIDLRYIPEGTTLTYEFTASISTYDVNIDEQIYTRYFFFVDSSGNVIGRSLHYFDPKMNGHGSYTWIETVSVSEFPDNAVGLVPMFVLRNFEPAFDDVMIYLSSFKLVIPMSALEFQTSQNEQMKATMASIETALQEQGKQLEELPDQIGDQMQNVMDTEKEQANEEGNKFVDQILDKLPDPSQGILDALGDLTAAVNYTGTDASLTIPAIVLPGIDGLFPETEIWGGTEFSFSEYVEMLPPGLLTLVTSLFTIAIVLFCVYELKGIISYCLTLREKDGG